MSKSVYSVVLSDEVIDLIDSFAIKKGLSRSQLINNVLAEYVGYDTEQKRIEDILSIMSEAIELNRRMRVVKHQQSAIDFLSALNYKYNPRVTYSVELFNDNTYSGVLKIALRTTNPYLRNIINEFFNKFIEIEQKYLKDVEYAIVDGKLVRSLDFSSCVGDDKSLANKITNYVNNIDKLINIYIEDYDFGMQDSKLEQNYIELKDSIDF